MTITLDPAAALVVIDLQRGIVSAGTVHPVGDVVSRVAALARAFRTAARPVVLVNVTGGAPGRTSAERRTLPAGPEWAELVPELDVQPGDVRITKQRWGAFAGTSLHEDLQTLGVTQIVLTGVATSIGVESTARAAYDLGYNVALVLDAMTDRDAEAHRNSVEKIFPRLGETDSTVNVLALFG